MEYGNIHGLDHFVAVHRLYLHRLELPRYASATCSCRNMEAVRPGFHIAMHSFFPTNFPTWSLHLLRGRVIAVVLLSSARRSLLLLHRSSRVAIS